MGDRGIRKVTKITILFFWIKVRVLHVRGNYIEKNGDLKLSYYLSTKYTIKDNIRVRKMCTYLQSDAFQQTWEEYKQICSQSESFFDLISP